MKKLKAIIKENKNLITTNCVFICYSKEMLLNKRTTGVLVDGYQVKIEDLTDEQLNSLYSPKGCGEFGWWIEDGDLCIA